MNFDVTISCSILGCLELMDDDFKVGLSTLMPSFDFLDPKYT